LILLCLASFSWNCSSDATRNNDPDTLTINAGEVASAGFSEVFDEVEYQPLQLPDGLFLASIDKVILTQNRLYVFDYRRSKRLFAFSMDGSYLFSISKVGRGPKEFIEPVDFWVDEKHIEILDATDKILQYDLRGQFLTEFKIPFNANKFFKLSDQEYVLYTKESANTSYGANVICDLLYYSRVSGENECILERSGARVPFIQERNNLFFSQKQVLFSKMFLDTIFTLDKQKLSTTYVLNFGDRAFPKDKLDVNKYSFESVMNALNGNTDKLYHSPELFSNEDYLITRYNQNGLYYLFYNKQQGTTQTLKVNTKNDLDGGIPFLTVHTIDERAVFALIDPNFFLDLYNEYQRNPTKTIDEKALKIAKEIDINDPPVLVRYSMKESK
jgi:hypothetical protein